ncbi:hypothetical protein ACGFNU_36925 [Spirillospora sp. NPDC048911]|uniref:hypothetical protein n=1 Tax=Spirillospora sp. NPDC048911 TaxID=3364527 RepID=UPI00371949C1
MAVIGTALLMALAVLDAKSGAERTRITLSEGGAIKCDVSDPTLCANLIVEGGVLFTKPSTMDSTGKASIVAFDLATGRPKWMPSGKDTDFLRPVGFEDGRLLVLDDLVTKPGDAALLVMEG